ncbi:MAG: hypothetical protein J5898_09065 [Lachnospiraceae bacterium]|nr:hypothetical protein [Lachnospiraceae bacterium]
MKNKENAGNVTIKIIRFLKLLCLPVVFWIFFLLYQIYTLQNAVMIVRYAFTGSNLLFHNQYEYYAVTGTSRTRVPAGLVALFYPEWDLEQSVFEDSENNYYYVQLEYCPDGTPLFNKPTIDIGKNREYILTYDIWTKKSNPMSDDAKDLAADAILHHYDFSHRNLKENTNQSGYIWNTGDRYGLDSFILVTRKGIKDKAVLYSDSSDTLSIMKSGQLKKVMNYPKNGKCQFVYFTEKW